MKALCICSLIVLNGIVTMAVAQRRAGMMNTASAAGTSSNTPGSSSSPVAAIKPYRQVITEKAISRKGLFAVHVVDDRYYFEIPNSLLKRDLLIVNRIGKAAAETRNQTLGYAGDEIGHSVVRFEKGQPDKLNLIQPMLGERSSDSSNMFRSLQNSSIQPVLAVFPVKAYGQDSLTGEQSYVIDLTEWLTGDNELFYFNNLFKGQLMLGGPVMDRSYLVSVKPYPANIEIKAIKTYSKNSGAATYELNSSIVVLPAAPMKSRYQDDRVGYFNTTYTDYDLNPQGIKKVSIVYKWRMEPKPEDVGRYLNGEKVEPQKPIVYYIDPSTPKKWIPYLMQGVNDWQPAFEQAGFKNAIMAKEAPTDDTTWSIDDARHSAIVYKPSAVPNAMGSEIYDPRSGEIIESHINWYHNIMKLLHDWYQIQASAVDTGAMKMVFDDELMGQLIRGVASHEVGHTLGLMHNYGASSSVPVDSLRSKHFVETYGHTPSIMDYARFNYVAQPEDHIGRSGILPRIGDYDKWAIEWGYKWYPGNKPEADAAALSKLATERLKNKRLFFGSELSENDPRCQNEDLGDNAMKAGMYGIKNLKRLMPKLMTALAGQTDDYDDTKTLFAELMKQYSQYMWHVCKYVGGLYETPKKSSQPGPVYQFVPGSLQRQAVQFIINELLTTPTWLINKDLMEKAGVDPVEEIKNAQIMAMSRLFMGNSIDNMIEAEAYTKDAYTLTAMLHDVKNAIWAEMYQHRPADIYRRTLQALYIDNLRSMTLASKFPLNAMQIWAGTYGKSKSLPDFSAIAKGHLRELQADIKKALPAATGIMKYHLEESVATIQSILNKEIR